MYRRDFQCSAGASNVPNNSAMYRRTLKCVIVFSNVPGDFPIYRSLQCIGDPSNVPEDPEMYRRIFKCNIGLSNVPEDLKCIVGSPDISQNPVTVLSENNARAEPRSLHELQNWLYPIFKILSRPCRALRTPSYEEKKLRPKKEKAHKKYKNRDTSPAAVIYFSVVFFVVVFDLRNPDLHQTPSPESGRFK